MRKQQELQAMEEAAGAALQANAHNLPLGKNRDELLRDIWRFRAEVAARKLTVNMPGYDSNTGLNSIVAGDSIRAIGDRWP
jgi:hypothetical protein